MYETRNIYGVLSPMFYTTKLFGLTPFSITSSCFRTSKLCVVYSLILILFLNTYTGTALSKRPEIRGMKLIAKITDILSAYWTQLTLCCGILFECIFCNKILRVIQDINTFDKITFKSLQVNTKEEYRKNKRNVVLGTYFALFCITAVISCTALDSPDLFTAELFGEFMAYVVPEIISTFTELQFCVLILCIKQRFCWINRKIETMRNAFENKFESIFSISKSETAFGINHSISSEIVYDHAFNTVEKIRIQHNTLCDIAKNLNKAYSIQILLGITQCFITIIVLLYYIGKHLSTDVHPPITYIVYCFAQVGLAVTQLLVLVIVCSSTTKEARKTGNLLHNMLALNRKEKSKENLQMGITSLSLQLLHQNIEFTACNAFVINESLLASIFSAITTYLVIVVQLELSHEV